MIYSLGPSRSFQLRSAHNKVRFDAHVAFSVMTGMIKIVLTIGIYLRDYPKKATASLLAIQVLSYNDKRLPKSDYNALKQAEIM